MRDECETARMQAIGTFMSRAFVAFLYSAVMANARRSRARNVSDS